MTIQDKDRIFVTGNRVDMMLFHNYFKSRAVKSLLIVGAGRIAYYLLGILKDSRIDTKVIEINPEGHVSLVRNSLISTSFKEMGQQKISC